VFQARIHREHKLREVKESAIQDMEREETALLKKLQEAQFRQQAAFEVLEDVTR